MSDAPDGGEPVFEDGPLPLITSERFEALASEWAELHRSTPPALPFSHPIWHEAWLRHCGAGAFPVFLALRSPTGEESESPLMGVIPLDVGGAEPRFLGDPDLSDHSGALIAPGQEAGAAAALIEWLMEDLSPGFEAWGLPEAGRLRPALLAAAARYGWTASEEPEAVTPTVELPETWEAYVAALPKKYRHELRRKLRNLERAGDVAFESATAPGEVAEVVEGLLGMMRESREEKAAFLTPEREAFFRDLATGLSEHGLARIATLTFDGQPAARIFALEGGGATMLYNSGFDPSLSQLAVGLLSKALLVRDAIERDRSAVDFLRGTEPYKRHLGGRPRDIVIVRLSGA
ncbi:MAG: GNAT family N-acetyltransferase [Chloroflexi bacterium]|nr:GNAT family N-acetyltransferase [Chloroflexota bacterium]